MDKKIVKKLNKRGFSLAEMLIAILILLMVSSIVAVGVPAAARALTKVVDASNAHVLLTTTMTELRDQFSTASADSINVADDGLSAVYVTTDGSKTEIRMYDPEKDHDGPGIYIQPYLDFYNSTPETDYTRLLVSKAAANKNLHATYGSLEYSDGVMSVRNLRVYKDSADKSKDGPIAEIPLFQVRVISNVSD